MSARDAVQTAAPSPGFAESERDELAALHHSITSSARASTDDGIIEYVRTGRLRALATTGAVRSGALPDTPIVGDFLPGYEASAWYGVCAPRNTSAEIVDKLNKEINAGIADAKLKARLAELGSTPFVASPSEFGKYLAEQTEKWSSVVKAANLKPE